MAPESWEPRGLHEGWEPFLSERDRQFLAQEPTWGNRKPRGFGQRPAVVVVDDYYGSLGTERVPLLESVKTWPYACGDDGWDAIDRTVELLDAARARAVPIIYLHSSSSRGHAALPPELAAKSNQIVDEIAPQPGDIVLQKPGASAFNGTPMISHLNELHVDTVLVVGNSTSGCVRATVVDGGIYRYRMGVVADCCFDRFQASHWISLFDMKLKFADVIDTEGAKRYFSSVSTKAAP